MQILVDNPTSW